MNITQIKNDGLTVEVELNFVKEDYADKKKKALNKFRRETDIKGFRKGNAPMSLVEKLHGGAALVDSINELISDNLNKYITDNKLEIIGEPLPIEDKDSKNDWENEGNFNFKFEIALAPKFDVSLSTDDKIVSYDVTVSAKAKEEYKENLYKQSAKLESCDTASEDDFVLADFVQGDKKVDTVYVSMKTLKEKEAKELFLGKKKGDEFDVDVVKTFPSDVDRAAMLKMKKEELEGLAPVWHVVVTDIKTYVDAKPGKELYDQLFGEGVVKDEKGFDEKVDQRMQEECKQESNYRFALDAKEYLIKKADIKLPEDFLKRWLFNANEGKFTMEEIEKDFPMFLKDFCWQTISQKIMRDQKLEVTKEALLEETKNLARYQFAMYGMSNVPEEHIVKYAQSMLQDEKQSRRIYEKVESDVVIGYVRSVVTLEEKKIASDKIRKMNEQQQ